MQHGVAINCVMKKYYNIRYVKISQEFGSKVHTYILIIFEGILVLIK